MCAPNAESDYYYYMTRCIQEKNSEFSASRVIGVPVEHAENDSDFDAAFENIAPKLTEDLDLVVIQLGENLAVSYYENGGCIRLLTAIRQRCPNARVCWAASWYTTEQKQTMFKKACRELGCTFIDTSNLRNDETNGKIGDVITYKNGETSIVETQGVASHPNQKGMLAIARRICYELGIIDSEDEIQE